MGNKSRTIGCDVNVKNNLLYLSDRTFYDIDRKVVDKFCKMMLQFDQNKSAYEKTHDDKYHFSEKKQKEIDYLNRKLISIEREMIVEMCKDLNKKHINHIVMEYLDNGFGKSYAKTDDGINYNRVIKFLHISSIKDEIKRIAKKYGIAVSFVQSHYTSKTCPRCGCIDSNNRKTQEDFKCICCGHSDNADHNASVNILNRVRSTVLRDELLTLNPDLTYVPKELTDTKGTVKNVLNQFYTAKKKKKLKTIVQV